MQAQTGERQDNHDETHEEAISPDQTYIVGRHHSHGPDHVRVHETRSPRTTKRSIERDAQNRAAPTTSAPYVKA